MVKEIDSRELERRLTTDAPPFLLDIRSEAEVMHGMLADSEHLPMHLIPLRVMDLPKDRDIVLYCRSGTRSYHACRFLMQQGFDNVINLSGGIIDWVRTGYEIVPMTEA